MKKMLKPMLLTTAALAAVVLIVFGSLIVWLESNRGLQWMQSQINAAIPGQLSIQRHRLSLLKFRLDLYDVVLRDPRGAALAGFSHLLVNLDGWALWQRKIQLDRVLLQGPWADLRPDQKAGTNLMAALLPATSQKSKPAASTEGTGLPLDIVFKSIQLTNGRLTFTSTGGSSRLSADGIDLSADGDLAAQRGRLKLQVSRIRFAGAGIHPPPSRIDLNARLDADKLSIPSLTIAAGKTTLNLSGSAAHLYTAPWVDCTLSAASRLGELKTLFDLPGDYGGRLRANLGVKGALANPEAGLDLNFDGGRIAGRALDGAKVSIHLKDRQATVESAAQLAGGTLALNGTVNLQPAFPSGLLSSPADINAVTYALNLVPDIPDLKPWMHPFLALGGRLTGRAALTGRGVDLPRISARLTLSASGRDLFTRGMDRPVKAALNLSARLDRGRLAISRLDAAAGGFDMSGDGRFQMDSRTLDGRLSIRASELSQALAVVGITAVRGSGNADLAVSGRLTRPQFTLKVKAEHLDVAAYTLGNLVVDAAMDADGRLHLTTLALQNRGSRIKASGRLRLLAEGAGIDRRFDNRLDLSLTSVSPTDFINAPPISGILDGRLHLTGPLESLEGDLSLDGRRLRSAAAAIGDVAAHLRLKAGRVVVDRLHLHNRHSLANAAGSIQLLVPGTLRLDKDPHFTLKATSDHLEAQDFVPSLKGNFRFAADLAGSISRPAGTLALTGSHARLAGQSLARLSLDARLKDRRLWLNKLAAAVVPGEEIDGRGWIGLDRTADLHIQSQGISAGSIHWLHAVFPGHGNIRFNATVKGRLENPDIDGRLSITDITVNRQAMQDVDLTFGLHDMRARVAGNLNFKVNADCDLRKGDFDARLRFDHTETAAYFKIAGRPDLHGTLSGRLEASGNLHDAANLSARLDLNALDLLFKKIPLIRSDRIALQLVDRKLTVPGVDLTVLSTGSLHLKGSAGLDGAVDMTVNGRIPLAAAGAFSDELAKAAGTLSVAGRVTGKTADPRIDGRIDLESISMAVPGLVQQLHDLNGHILLSANRIRIEALHGFLDTGSFNLAGSVDLEKYKPSGMHLELTAKSLPLEVPDTLSTLLNADIQITGSQRSAAASGKIVIQQGVYYKDVKINLLKLATTRRRSVAPPSQPISLPFFDTVKLDITVGYREPFAVQNNLAELEINPDLHIGGTLARPIVNGRAQVRSGTITFQKKTFDVKKGVVDFTNPYKTEAHIDIQGETTIRTWTITLTIEGTPDDLDLKLSSVPSETNADILSLILFGRTAQELSGGQSVSKRSTSQILTDLVADTFGEDIKKKTGIDIFQVETDSNGTNQGAAGVKVTVGKHLSNRMTVKYAVETKNGEVVQRAITEYMLLENILVSGFQDTQGIYGSELTFRIEFR
jgi:autotransporter translocation and assembly factor TamB